MQEMLPSFGIIVPVRDEAAILRTMVPKLLDISQHEGGRVVWVCNGCSDESARLIRALAGRRGEIIELFCPSKTAALQAGDEALGDLYPRFYIDADTSLSPGHLSRLARHLTDGTADLVSPRLQFDFEGASSLSARIGACWMSLPHARSAAFSNVIGVSRTGRAMWGRWPDILGDDIFVSAHVPKSRKMIVAEATATVRMPGTFRAWVTMRARWLKGEAQLRQLGLEPDSPPNQRVELLRQMVHPRTATGAWAFASARLLASLIKASATDSDWLPDRSEKW